MTDFRTIFAAADAKASAAVSRVFGERFELHPWTKGGRLTLGGGADPDRAIVTFTATFGGAMGTQKIGGERPGNEMNGPAVTTREKIISADFLDWPAHAQIGDRLRALQQAGQPWSTIAAINNDGVNRVFAKVVPA